jgi:hypothetical protein
VTSYGAFVRLGPIVEVTIASRDVERQVDFLRRAFGFERLEDQGDAVVAGVPGVAVGRVRIVHAESDPDVPEPLGWEIGPRLVAVRTRDVARAKEQFEAAGGRAGPTVTYRHPETQNDEFVGLGPDDVLWAVAFAVGGRPSPALEGDSERLCTEVFSCVVNVEDADAERHLLADAGWQTLLDFTFDGREIEQVLGLPHGATLKFLMFADPENSPARLELMQFFGVSGGAQRERPVGIRRVTFAVDDLEAGSGILERAGASPAGPGIYVGPAGLELELRPLS